MLQLTWPQALAFRLGRQSLEERATPKDLLEVVSRTGGLHAQIMSAAELAAFARIDGLDSEEVRAALWRERTLVKTWAMRWTLHLLPSVDYPAYLAAFRSFTYFRNARWLASYGVTAEDMTALLDGMRDTLNGDSLTREQLAEAVAQHTGRPYLRDKLLSGWGTLLKPGAYQGHLIFGPSRGQAVTFVSPRHWLTGSQELATGGVEGDGRLEIARRYLSTYGPATPGDFGHWWGASQTDSRKIFKALGDELVPVSIEGWNAWCLRVDADTLISTQASGAVRLLPGFDPYTLGLRREREAALPVERKGRVYSQQGWISAVVLVGGYVVGIWTYKLKSKRLDITVEPFTPLSPTVREGIEQEAARLGAYFHAEPTVTVAV